MSLLAYYVPSLTTFVLEAVFVYNITAFSIFWTARNRHSIGHTVITLSVGLGLGIVGGLLLTYWDMREPWPSLAVMWDSLVEPDFMFLRRGWVFLLSAPVLGMLASWLSLELLGPNMLRRR